MPVPEQPYALALGRIDLFRSFYRMQGHPFPAQFSEEFERIEMLHDPRRTAALEGLNDTILETLTKHFFDRIRTTPSEDVAHSHSPREKIQELRNHLAQRNPYFRLWVVYRIGLTDGRIAEEWDEYVLQELGAESAEEIAFAHGMVELDKLLALFHDRNWALPGLAFERILFLHSLRGPERMPQTRAVLGMLTTELTACASA
jgi:hypothetical protein